MAGVKDMSKSELVEYVDELTKLLVALTEARKMDAALIDKLINEKLGVLGE